MLMANLTSAGADRLTQTSSRAIEYLHQLPCNAAQHCVVARRHHPPNTCITYIWPIVKIAN